METNTALLALSKKFAGLVKRKFGNNLVSIVLFGSLARKETGHHSDIDLLLIFEKLPCGRFARSKLLEPIEDILEKDLQSLRSNGIYTRFNYIIKNKEEASIIRPLYFDMTQEAVYLYDKAHFFKHVINDLKQRLGKLGAERKRAGRVRYWELKPDYKPGEVFEI